MPGWWWLAPVAALGCGLAAVALTPWLAGTVAGRPSRWYGRRLPGWLSALIGGAAATLAGTWVQLVTFSLVALGLGLLVAVDLAEERLPDTLTLPLYPVLLGGLALDAALGGGWPAVGQAVLAGLVALAVFLLLALLGPLYPGDVKLAGVLGAWLGWFGWWPVLGGFFAAFALHALVGIGLMAARRANRSTEFAFGPSLVAGTLIVLVGGRALGWW